MLEVNCLQIEYNNNVLYHYSEKHNKTIAFFLSGKYHFLDFD